MWSVASGYCFVTFSDHRAAVTAVKFLPSSHALISASLDGTVRAFDLVRYRNFRTFTTPEPVQFVCVAVDSSGEVVCAGSRDSFQVFLWSLKTGKLLNVLAGHEGPVVDLAFSPSAFSNALALLFCLPAVQVRGLSGTCIRTLRLLKPSTLAGASLQIVVSFVVCVTEVR